MAVRTRCDGHTHDTEQYITQAETRSSKAEPQQKWTVRVHVWPYIMSLACCMSLQQDKRQFHSYRKARLLRPCRLPSNAWCTACDKHVTFNLVSLCEQVHAEDVPAGLFNFSLSCATVNERLQCLPTEPRRVLGLLTGMVFTAIAMAIHAD